MKTYSRKKQEDSQEVILHLNELCRLCMAKEEQLVPIFNEDEAIPLTLRIMACLSLEVFEGDGLPNKICHPCRYQLEKSYAFRKKCEQSDVKLRQHLKKLREKLGGMEVAAGDDEQEARDEESQMSFTETVHAQASTEEDLVGVPQVAYIDPPPAEPINDDPENITLPADEDLLSRDACTLDQLGLKKEAADVADMEGESESMIEESVYLLGEGNSVAEEQEHEQPQTMDDPDLEAIADAVKTTLASHPGLNLNGELQMKVDQQPGKPTQVQVTAEDGSIFVIELVTEEEEPDDADADADGSAAADTDVNDEGELKIFQCPECPKSFSRRIQLRRHASVHMQQRGFSCGICEKWFPTRSALVRHERIHTGERPFQCEVCQKCFAQKEILFRHLMTHTGQKPYNCPHCPKGFSQKEPLRVHLKTHLSSAPDIQLHYCSLCPKVFCHASGLSRHLVTHTGKMFKCRDCDKAFTDKSSLRRHHRQTLHQE